MTTARKLKCENIQCPHEEQKKFSDWVRAKLPDSFQNFRAYDLDWIFWIKDFGKIKKIMIVEVKTRNAPIRIDQDRTYRFLDECIKQFPNRYYEYWGYHIIRFENTFFDDGKVYFDSIESTEKDIIETLSFRMKPPL